MIKVYRNFAILCFIVFSLAIIGCDTDITEPIKISGSITIEPSISLSDSQNPNVDVGIVTSLTGSYATPYGLPMYRGLELARQHINASSKLNTGGMVNFITSDDLSTVEGAKSAVSQLVNQNVSAIVGITTSTQLVDAFPIANENGIVAFSPLSSAAGLSSLGEYIFRAAIATDIFIPGGVSVTASSLGYEKASIIYDSQDVYSGSVRNEFNQALLSNGVDILTEQSFETGDTDFSTQLADIMKLDNDVIFIAGLSSEMRMIIDQARKIGIQSDVDIICADLADSDVQAIGDNAEGVITFTAWSHLSDTNNNRMFVSSYKDFYGIDPEPWAAQGYASLNILIEAINIAGSTEPDLIRDALAKTRNLPTILGDFSFDANGEAIYDPIVLIVKDGTLQLFE